MTPEALYLLAWLEGIGETGWAESSRSDPEHGRLIMVRGEERIEYHRKMSGWRPVDCPERLRGRVDSGFRSPWKKP